MKELRWKMMENCQRHKRQQNVVSVVMQVITKGLQRSSWRQTIGSQRIAIAGAIQVHHARTQIGGAVINLEVQVEVKLEVLVQVNQLEGQRRNK